MSRIRLRLDIDVDAFENDLVTAIAGKLPGTDAATIREAVHAVLQNDLVVAEWCGTRLFCSEVEAFGPLGGCSEK